jgi:L-ascorbate metabolism protein UlaG (beta-lactamase superfamily)
MKLEYLGHSSFLLTRDDGTRILTDPYKSGSFQGAVGYGPIKCAADIVTVSHDHADHNYVADVEGNPLVIKEDGTFEPKGIPIVGIVTDHDDKDGKERGKNIVFKFCVDGINFVHLGDLGRALSEDEVTKLGDVDVLLIPVGGYFTIDATTADIVTKQLKPKVVIPMHYKTAKSGFPIATVEEFIALRDRVKKMPTSTVEIDKTSLPANAMETWIFPYSR